CGGSISATASGKPTRSISSTRPSGSPRQGRRRHRARAATPRRPILPGPSDRRAERDPGAATARQLPHPVAQGAPLVAGVAGGESAAVAADAGDLDEGGEWRVVLPAVLDRVSAPDAFAPLGGGDAVPFEVGGAAAVAVA